mmetsp:Transcript_5274/g.14978  ORF Transcript_5274/g.14978 Transcript_5274/m.14978 type:complete len:233 (+) Transcript_5274:1539-2237(+)
MLQRRHLRFELLQLTDGVVNGLRSLLRLGTAKHGLQCRCQTRQLHTKLNELPQESINECRELKHSQSMTGRCCINDDGIELALIDAADVEHIGQCHQLIQTRRGVVQQSGKLLQSKALQQRRRDAQSIRQKVHVKGLEVFTEGIERSGRVHLAGMQPSPGQGVRHYHRLAAAGPQIDVESIAEGVGRVGRDDQNVEVGFEVGGQGYSQRGRYGGLPHSSLATDEDGPRRFAW